MRILVCIAYYGTRNRDYVDRLVAEYRSMDHDVDIVVVSEAEKDLPGVELRVGLPSDNPWSLPFAHKAVFAERRDDYDLFVYSEDDTLVSQHNIEAFLWSSEVLPADHIAGFIRSEETPDGRLRCSSQHSFYHWVPGSAFRAEDGTLFAEFSNMHGACYLLTRSQLATCLDSGNYLTDPREGEYDMLVTAATDPYTVCGLRRVMSIDRLSDFTLPHLTNRYTDSLGVPFEEVEIQVEELRRMFEQDVPPERLLTDHEDGLSPHWRKHYHEPVLPAVVDAVPGNPGTVLSIGAGDGRLEAALAERGHKVTAIPLDSVIGSICRSRGVEVITPDLTAALDSLEGCKFEAIVMSDVLTRLPDPIDTLQRIRRVARPGAPLVVVSPNVLRARLRRLTRRSNEPWPTPLGGHDLGTLGARKTAGLLAAGGFTQTVSRGLGRRILSTPLSEWLTHPRFLTTGRSF